jgi:DNA polymerase-3 subunit gamma/tau
VSHQVLSRKYRPQRFDELVGQEHVARIFQNALASGRVGHAYLLVGPRGVGKTTTARIVARALNCEALQGRDADGGAEEAVAPVEPCGTCPSCRDIAAGADLDVVEMDAASNNAVDDVRSLREQVAYATVRSPHRIWIVDEVHMLSLPAFNAFLKTLEEPPAHVKFLFCTTEEHKLPDTFRSRCQRVEFRPIDAEAMAARLEELAAGEGVRLADGLARAIAQGALGGLRDAESQLEQLIAARGPGDEPIRPADLDALSGRAPAQRLAELLEAVEARDAGRALDAVDACLAAGGKPGVLLDQWLEALREGMVAAVRAGGSGWARAARAIDLLLAKRAHLRGGADGGLVAQVAAVELARLPDARDLDALVQALRGGSAPAPEGPARPTRSRDAPRERGSAARAARAPAASARATRSPPAPPPASPSAEPEGLARVRAAWPAIVERASRRSPLLGRVLTVARLTALDGDALTVGVPEEDPEARGTLRRREMCLAVAQITESVLGSGLRLVLADAAPAAPAPTPALDLRGHPAVRAVTEATGGRLLTVERTRDADEGSASGGDGS